MSLLMDISKLEFGELRRTVARRGLVVWPAAVDLNFCRGVVDLIDAHAQGEQVQMNYGGSEVRVWDAERRSGAFRAFWELSNALVSGVEQQHKEAFTLLAIRNRQIPEGADFRAGRWHLDSLSRQLKVFLFLTDVTEESGPLELVPETNRSSFKFSRLLRGHYITPRDIVARTRRYSGLEDGLVANYGMSIPLVVPAGTVVLVDTSCVHRARPCTAGTRYALTSYYR